MAPGQTVDLRNVVRRLVAWPTAALLLAGALGGLLVRTAAGQQFATGLEWSLPALACPTTPGQIPANFFTTFVLPASLAGPAAEGTLACSLSDDAAVRALRCEVQTVHEQAAPASADAAIAAMAQPQSVLATTIADLRIGNVCGQIWAVTPEYAAAREAVAGGPRLVSTRLLPPTVRFPQAPLFGLVAGLFAALLVAAWRARAAASVVPDVGLGGPVATGALVGLLATSSMSNVLVVDVGTFTVRFGQLCALVFFAAVLRERRQRGALTLGAGPVLTGLAWLALAAASATTSYIPGKSLGYLAWAAFDLLVVFGGIALWATTPQRLRFALRAWLAGMALAVGMGAVQLGTWALGGSPPLMGWDTLGLPRINGFSYEPAYFALYLVPGLLFLSARVARLGRRALGSGALAVALLAAVALSTSRSGWLGTAVGLALLLVLLVLRGGRQAALRLGALALAGTLASGALLAASPTLRGHLGRFAKMGVDRTERTSSAPRLIAMSEAAAFFRAHPVTGVGFAGYGGYALAHPAWLRPSDRGAHGVVTTNLYLELAAETGLVGLLAALGLLSSVLWPLFGRLRRPLPSEPAELAAARDGLLLSCVVVFAVMFQFNQTLWRLDIWILLALSFAAAVLPEPEPR